MHRLFHAVLLTSMFACSLCPSNAEAQVYYYPSTGNYVPQNQGIVRTPTRVYADNGIRYQSQRPTYGHTRVYSNGRYYVSPSPTYTQNGVTYYYPQSRTYYQNVPSNQPTYYGQGYGNQPPVTYQYGYGTGMYSSPQQAANANAGAIIGGAIGGNQGAQVGAAIGGSIRP